MVVVVLQTIPLQKESKKNYVGSIIRHVESILRSFQITTANITIDRRLQKLCEFGFSEALRDEGLSINLFIVWFLCMALQEVLPTC